MLVSLDQTVFMHPVPRTRTDGVISTYPKLPPCIFKLCKCTSAVWIPESTGMSKVDTLVALPTREPAVKDICCDRPIPAADRQRTFELESHAEDMQEVLEDRIT